MARSRARGALGIPGTLLLLSGGAACSLLTDLDGLSGTPSATGVDGGPVPDGAADVRDDGGVAPIDDAAAHDSATSPDGAVVPAFCAGSTHAFCADFEDSAPIAAWTLKESDPGTSTDVSTTRARLGTHSLLSTTPKRAASTPNLLALLDKAFDGSWRRLVLELDIYEEQPAWSSGDINAALLSVETQSGTNGKAWYLTSGPSYTNLNDIARAAMPTNQWVHVKIDYDPGGTISGMVGNTSYAATFAAQTPGAKPLMLVRVGIDGFNSPAPKLTVYYDNVTIDLL